VRLIDFFDKGAAVAPDRAFLIDDAGRRTYREVQRSSHRIVNALRRDGITPGTRAAVYAPNATRAFECVIGLIRAGCVWVPVNVRNLVEDTVHVLKHCDTEVLFYSAGFSANVARILEQCPGIRRVICLEAPDGGHPGFDDWIAGMLEISEDVEAGRDDLATLFSSGGTTGKPKGVMMSHLAWETMVASSLALQPHPKPIHLVAAPMTHAAGGSALAMMPMAATNIMLPGFDPVRVMESIEKYRVTHLFLPPTAIYKLLAHPDVRRYDYSSLRYFNYASAPMSPDKLKEALDVFGPVMMTAFGQTETGVNVCYFSPQDHAAVLASGDHRRFLSCGRASPFFRVAIMDDEGRLLPAGERGEIVVRGNSVMKGYYKNLEETAKAQAHGWHHTSDVGYLDEEGWLFLMDRKRDMIVSGGFNLYPAEIEKVILGHPSVQDCAVIGVPDDLWGEAVKAVLEMKPGAAFDADALMVFCRQRLSGYKVPKSIEAWAELPRSPVGKLLKRVVREKFWQGRERSI
jgi:acyl-CoA synthetase (AMP-forming)/AMP-acid ligase II